MRSKLIIFICRFDLFEKGKHLYIFENRCIQYPELAFGDETQKIILNTTSKENDIPLALKMFLDYVKTGEVQDEFTAELEMEVDKIRKNKKWRDEIMTYEQEWENEKDSLCRQWKAEGREEGLDLGLNQAYIKYASKMLKNGSTYNEILNSLMDMFDISTEKAEEIITAIND